MPPATLRHSLALPVSTTGRAWAARLPREPKRSIRGDWRYGRFYQLTGMAVPEPLLPGKRLVPAPWHQELPLHPARRHPGGSWLGGTGKPLVPIEGAG